ncbi:MarR family winged helix-turn-helix transcriptional regulator [Desulfobaculum sp. SPO524]|jgi:MarR family transcriptional regulator for hemolysin|uniref:MarR family winged helix-turn-helix transcriptional regulator n=1 Tax=Desulfobaculum sp. SPO524 TaxID=3378071 RepID=UPI0038520AC7
MSSLDNLDVKVTEIFKTNSRQLGVLIAAVAREWRMRLDERMKPFGISGARWVTLVCLSELGAVSQKQLAEAMGIEGPTLVRLLDRLEKDGWVSRHVSEQDRRVKIVVLEPKAHAFLDEFEEIAIGIRDEAIQDLPERDLAACTNVLLHLQDKLSAMGHAN